MLLYGIHSAWGYAGLSWFCALALVELVACLQRNPNRTQSGPAAALAILAMPALALRATPRVDLFATLLFSIYLAPLWRYQQGSDGIPSSSDELGSAMPGGVFVKLK